MKVHELPFNALVGIKETGDGESLLTLPFSEPLANHLGTFHASAIFALAEASSGSFLIRARGEREDIGGVVRKTSGKYSAPGTSTLTSRSETDVVEIQKAMEKVDSRGRALVTIDIAIHDEEETLIGRFSFDWLLAKTDESR